MYPLFETIQILNGKAQNLAWHQDRMDRSHQVLFHSRNKRKLNEIVLVPDEFRQGTVKCRFMYNQSSYALEFSAYEPRKIRSLKLVKGDHLEYSLKYTDRSDIHKLLETKEECDDILIMKHGLISDTSYTNVVFYDGKKWVSPAKPLLEGTCRNRLLAEKKIITGDITPGDLENYSYFRLINSMLLFEQQENLAMDSIILQ